MTCCPLRKRQASASGGNCACCHAKERRRARAGARPDAIRWAEIITCNAVHGNWNAGIGGGRYRCCSGNINIQRTAGQGRLAPIICRSLKMLPFAFVAKQRDRGRGRIERGADQLAGWNCSGKQCAGQRDKQRSDNSACPRHATRPLWQSFLLAGVGQRLRGMHPL